MTTACFLIQVIDETLSPTWDELLVFDEILVYGTREEIKNNPPTIIIEIFDQDKVVSYYYICHFPTIPQNYSKIFCRQLLYLNILVFFSIFPLPL